jgi:hypothetical protein
MKLEIVGVLLFAGCAHVPPSRTPLSASEATTQAQSECQAFAKDTATVDVDQCVAERAPRIMDADRVRAHADAAASEGIRRQPPPPAIGPCRWRAEYRTMTDCQ